MKKLVLLLMLVMAFVTITNAQTYNVSGNTYIQNKIEKQKVEPIKTVYKYQDSKGKEYDIYMTPSSGSCFVYKISSKTGKEYKQYLGEEISKDICRKSGKEYKGKSSESNITKTNIIIN